MSLGYDKSCGMSNVVSATGPEAPGVKHACVRPSMAKNLPGFHPVKLINRGDPWKFKSALSDLRPIWSRSLRSKILNGFYWKSLSWAHWFIKMFFEVKATQVCQNEILAGGSNTEFPQDRQKLALFPKRTLRSTQRATSGHFGFAVPKPSPRHIVSLWWQLRTWKASNSARRSKISSFRPRLRSSEIINFLPN